MAKKKVPRRTLTSPLFTNLRTVFSLVLSSVAAAAATESGLSVRTDDDVADNGLEPSEPPSDGRRDGSGSESVVAAASSIPAS